MHYTKSYARACAVSEREWQRRFHPLHRLTRDLSPFRGGKREGESEEWRTTSQTEEKKEAGQGEAEDSRRDRNRRDTNSCSCHHHGTAQLQGSGANVDSATQSPDGKRYHFDKSCGQRAGN